MRRMGPRNSSALTEVTTFTEIYVVTVYKNTNTNNKL
jgi:hypothetical protein